ncbi:MAG: aminopeptidase P family protein [Candidatus Heimdallarchaeota archaeon]|nr:MAG: aminopeptidase P family protein [Candidatus Heimdallarchaeota archaeon]
MIDDLDTELDKVSAEAILIIGVSTSGNPPLAYVAGCNIPRGGLYIKKTGEDPVLIVGDLDVGSAKKGLVQNIRPYSQFNFMQLIGEHGIDEARVRLFDEVLKGMGVHKRVVLSGMIEAGQAIDITRRLEKHGYEVIAEPELIERVRRTKSPHELELIAQVARKTEKVVHKTFDMLRNCPVSGEIVLHNKAPLTVADVKTFINRNLAEENLVAVFDTIFAPGSDGADPHNHGTPEREIKRDIPIVFDIFPQDVSTGYCFDTTRTFVIGNAPHDVKKTHEDVAVAQQTALDQIAAGADGQMIARSVCEVLEARKHKTPLYYLQNPGMAMEEGFIHGLGHGVGLTIGEPPSLSLMRECILAEGDVVTVEPGVYYPGKYGIRIEDTVTVEKTGFRNFSTLDKSLELK